MLLEDLYGSCGGHGGANSGRRETIWKAIKVIQVQDECG
jgi:hypothetical protein